MTGKGGRRGTTWNSQWNHGNTKHIRVPAALVSQIIEFARALDSGVVHLDSEQLHKTVLLWIDQFVEQRIAEFHPNQHTRIASTNSRRWDELRRFRNVVAISKSGSFSQSPVENARR
ncbi:MAG: hypothetical protein ACYT04_41145 [Nostoc sp.]